MKRRITLGVITQYHGLRDKSSEVRRIRIRFKTFLVCRFRLGNLETHPDLIYKEKVEEREKEHRRRRLDCR